MSLIPGTNILAPVVPFDTADTNPTHIDTYGFGGWRSVADDTARDTIPATRRVEGMIVFTKDDDKEWQLGSDLTTWTEFMSGVTGPGSSTDNAVVRWDGTGGNTLQNSTILVSDASALVFTTAATPDSATYNICRDDDGAENLHFNVPAGAAGTIGPGFYFSFNGTNRFTVDNLSTAYLQDGQSNGSFSSGYSYTGGAQTAVAAAFDIADIKYQFDPVEFVDTYVASSLTATFLITNKGYNVEAAGAATLTRVATLWVDGAPGLGAGVTATGGTFNALFNQGTVGIADDLIFIDSDTPATTTYNIRKGDSGATNLTFTVPAGAAGEAGPGYSFNFGAADLFFVDNRGISFTQDAQTDGTITSLFSLTANSLSSIGVADLNTHTILIDFNGAVITTAGGGSTDPVVTMDVTAPTYANSGGSLTIGSAATMRVAAPITGASTTIRDTFGVWSAGGLRFDGGLVGGRTEVDISASDYTVLTTDFIVAVTSTGANEVHLPDPEEINTAHIFIIKDEAGDAASLNIVVDVSSGATIDGELSISITANYGCLRVYSNGVSYFSF